MTSVVQGAPAFHSFQQDVQALSAGSNVRMLEAVTSTSSRVGNLGPALFAIILVGIVAIIMCSLSGFIDKPGPRRSLRAGACVLILLPVLFFSTVTYVSDSSQIVANRKTDDTYKPRFFVTLALILCLILSLVSLFAGESSPILMHRQGRVVYSSSKGGA